MVIDMASRQPVAEAGRHHNNPPLPERLQIDYAHFADEVEKIAARATALPREITSDSEVGQTGDVVKDTRALFRKIEDTRVDEKEPFLTGCKQVDAFFKAPLDRLDNIIKALEKRASVYQREKAEAERRRREEEARLAREEAQRQADIAARQAAAARPVAAEKHLAKAEQLDRKADDALTAATAPTAELTRTVSSSGTVVSASDTWNFEIEDLNKVPLDALRPYFGLDVIEKALRQYVKKNKGSAPLAGVRIFQDTKATFR